LKACRVDAQTGRSQQVDGSLLVGGSGFAIAVLVHEHISARPLFPLQATEIFEALHGRLRTTGMDR
ncbi:MAG: hypothetical protein WAN75_00865, partial [Xanthobacteraceae bacterium]